MALDAAEITLTVRGKKARATLQATESDAEGVRQALGAVEDQAKGAGPAVGASMKEAATGTRRAADATEDFSNTTGSATGIVFNFGQAIEDSSYSMRGGLNNLVQMGSEFQNLTAKTGSSRAALAAVTSALVSPVGLLVAVQAGVTAFTLFGDRIFGSMTEGKEAVEDFESSFSDMINVVSGRTGISLDLWIGQAKELREELKGLPGELDKGFDLGADDVEERLEAFFESVDENGTEAKETLREMGQLFGPLFASTKFQGVKGLRRLFEGLGVDVEAIREVDYASEDLDETYRRAASSLIENRGALTNLTEEAEAFVSTLDEQIRRQESASRAFDMLKGSLEGSEKPLKSVREQYAALQERLSRQQEDGVATSLEAAGERASFLREALRQLSGLGIDFDTAGIQALQAELVRAEQLKAQLERGPIPERPDVPAFEGEDYTIELDPINFKQWENEAAAMRERWTSAEERFAEQLTRLKEEEARIAGESQESVLRARLERTRAALEAEGKTQAEIHNLKLREQQLSNQLAREEQRRLGQRLRRVEEYSRQFVNAMWSAADGERRISEVQAEIQEQRFQEERRRLDEQLRTREISRERHSLEMRRIAEEEAEYEKRVEESRASFMERSARGVLGVFKDALRERLVAFVSTKASELLIQQSTETAKTAAQATGAATRAGAEVAASATAQATKGVETATHVAAEAQKTAATAAGTSARTAMNAGEQASTLASAAARMVDVVAILVEEVAKMSGPAAIFTVPAAIGAMSAIVYGGFEATKGLFGFAEGGYTGNGGKHEPAGVVHRGEFVMTKAATSGNERGLYGLMSLLQKGEITLTPERVAMMRAEAGYSTGGAVAMTTPAPQVVSARESNAGTGAGEGFPALMEVIRAGQRETQRVASETLRLAEEVRRLKQNPPSLAVGDAEANQIDRANQQERWRSEVGVRR